MNYDRDGYNAEFRIAGLSKVKCLKIMGAIEKYDVRIEMYIAHSNYADIKIFDLSGKLSDFQKAVEKANEIYSEKSVWETKSESDF